MKGRTFQKCGRQNVVAIESLSHVNIEQLKQTNLEKNSGKVWWCSFINI